MEPQKPKISLKLSPRLSLLKNKYVLASIIAVSIISGFVIYRSFAGTDPASLSQITLEGNLEVVHKDDFINKKSTMGYTLVSDSGVRTKVDLPVEPKERIGKQRVRLKGTMKSGKLVVKQASDNTLLQTSVVGTSATPVLSQAQLATDSTVATAPTPHKTAVILYNYSDNRSEPISAADARNKIFDAPNSASAFFKEESYGKQYLTGIDNPNGDVFGYVTISNQDTSCSNYDWAVAAQAAVTTQGHNLDAYDNLVFVSPAQSCPYGGLGMVNGRFSWVFINSANSLTYTQPIAEHELTHNFGTMHANSYYCQHAGSGATLGDSCEHNEYGDPYDVMGYDIYHGHTYHSNNDLLEVLGWLPSSQIQTISGSGDYSLYPQERNDSSIKSLKILRSYDQYNVPQYLYIEYRQSSPLFDVFPVGDEALKGVMIRSGAAGAIDSHILNVFHETTSTSIAYNSYNLHDGQTVTDIVNNLSIKQLSHTMTKATIRVTQPTPPTPDVTGPSAPTNFTRTMGTTKVNMLQWTASPEKDTSFYKVYRDGKYIGSAYPDGTTSTTITYQDWSSLTTGTHKYFVRAFDYAGNYSALTVGYFTTPNADTVKPTAPANISVSAFSPTVSAPIMAGGTGGGGALICWSAATDNIKVMGYIVNAKNTTTGLVTKLDTRLDYMTGTASCLVDTTKGIAGVAMVDYEIPGSKYAYSVQAYDGDLNLSPPTKLVPFNF